MELIMTVARHYVTSYFHNVVFDWKDCYHAERNLLAIAKFLVYNHKHICKAP